MSFEIYNKFCEDTGRGKRALNDGDKKRRCVEAYRTVCHEEPSEEDIQELMSGISYVKNMNCLDDNLQISEEVAEKINDVYPNFVEMYREYKKQLYEKYQMDYDDQMVYAFWILNNNSDILNGWQSKYEYICVDEAQDTSKIQYEIIRMLSVGNNVFMVGDEDQSIYGFRGAYPRAFLNFRFDYTNPYILRMETNYRSTRQIVDKAQAFISKNKGRYEKNMVSARGSGENVHLVKVNTVEEQYYKILEIAKQATEETAILYRDNESAIVLVDLFLRNKINFKLKKPEQNVLKSRVFNDIKDYLSLAVSSDPNIVADAFERVYYKGVTNIKYFPKKQMDFALKKVRTKGIQIFDAVDEQMQYLPYKRRNMATNFRNVMTVISKQSSYDAIETLIANGYSKYMDEKGLSKSKITVIKVLAKQEPNISKFLDRLDELESEMQKEVIGNEDAIITLSTIHTSKGLEYNNVYIIDVYDGRFPSTKTNYFSRAKDNADGDMEERRLFYVGMTRAKNSLMLFSIKDSPSQYIEELFPEIQDSLPTKQPARKQSSKKSQISAPARIEPKKESPSQYELMVRAKIQEENRRKIQERLRYNKAEEERLKKEKLVHEERVRQTEDIKKRFTEPLPEKPIWDSYGDRWVKCKCCSSIKRAAEFSTYGGADGPSLGICRECYEKGRR